MVEIPMDIREGEDALETQINQAKERYRKNKLQRKLLGFFFLGHVL